MRNVLLVVAVILSGCRGGSGADSSCHSIGPNSNAGVVSGNVSNLQAAADGDLGTFATLDTQAAGFIDSGGNNFPGGAEAGVFITPPNGATATDITVSTFFNSENATVESATGPTLMITQTQGDPATEYASFKTTAPFNGVKLTVNGAGSSQYLVYEICGNAVVR